jgi:hypothetical protein
MRIRLSDGQMSHRLIPQSNSIDSIHSCQVDVHISFVLSRICGSSTTTPVHVKAHTTESCSQHGTCLCSMVKEVISASSSARFSPRKLIGSNRNSQAA